MTNPVLDPARYPVLPTALLEPARVVPHRVAALTLWPKDAVIAEVGVALGEFSSEILAACLPRRFLAIDRFDLHELPLLWGKSTREHFGGRTHGDYYRDRFARQIADGQVKVIQGDSSAAITELRDASVDVFYVDADHSYEGVRRDLAALAPKVKPEGWVVLNDYIPAEIGGSNEPYGVIQATNEFMVEQGWAMSYFALAYVMYCDVGLRKATSAGARDLAALRARVADLEEALTVTRRSTSWRVTAPLRAIARGFGR